MQETHRVSATETSNLTASAAFVWGIVRIALGWIFLWAFLDKLFGLGRSTPSAKSWLNGGSPTTGYLTGVKGPFAGLFHGLAGQAWADWLFMIGLLGIGAVLIGLTAAQAGDALGLGRAWAKTSLVRSVPLLR